MYGQSMVNRENLDAGSELAELELHERAGGARLTIHVRPRSSRSAILGVREHALEVALNAPPADGAANAELLRLLAKALDVRRSDLTIVVGASGRKKVVEVSGITVREARERLAPAVSGGSKR